MTFILPFLEFQGLLSAQILHSQCCEGNIRKMLTFRPMLNFRMSMNKDRIWQNSDKK